MIAYRLESIKELKIVNNSWLYDIDEDFTSKKAYIERAEQLTRKVNKEFNTNYTYQKLFGEPEDIGWRYCKRCDTYYWKDDCCDCE